MKAKPMNLDESLQINRAGCSQIPSSMRKTLYSAVFPDGYPDPPSDQELQEEVERIIQQSENIPYTLLCWLRKTECPYLREAYARALRDIWTDMEDTLHESAGYVCDGCWRPYWPDYKTAIRKIIRQAQTEQLQLEKEKTNQEPEEPVVKISKPATVKKQEFTKIELHVHLYNADKLTINDIHDNTNTQIC